MHHRPSLIVLSVSKVNKVETYKHAETESLALQENVTAVLTASTTDVLSHVAIRARSQKVRGLLSMLQHCHILLLFACQRRVACITAEKKYDFLW